MENDEKKRYGTTTVTSVSVSKEFFKLMKEFDLSPTECLRRGIAVTLCDLGVGMYQSPKNETRSKFMHDFLSRIEEEKKLGEEYKNMKLFISIKKYMSSIKKIAEEIEKEVGGENETINQ